MPHPGALTIDLAGERITALPSRCLWWQARRALFVADIHAGKADAFRVAGVPAPAQVTASDLDRLAREAEAQGAARIVILGDLFHARAGLTDGCLATLRAWRERIARIDILLIVGNHDARSGVPADLDIRIAPEGLIDGPFELRHYPRPSEASPTDPHATGKRAFALAGHIHPVARLSQSRGMASLRAPCFWITPRGCVLPAFGAFTGGHRITPSLGDRVLLVGPDRVMEAPLLASPRSR